MWKYFGRIRWIGQGHRSQCQRLVCIEIWLFDNNEQLKFPIKNCLIKINSPGSYFNLNIRLCKNYPKVTRRSELRSEVCSTQ